VLSCAAAQVAKVFTTYNATRSWDWALALTSGGMPSSHTALVVALTTAIGMEVGCVVCVRTGRGGRGVVHASSW